MLALVLSGGGCRGAIQAGVAQELFEHGIIPEMYVGTSAGALNAVFLATEPTLANAQRLSSAWLSARAEDIFPRNPVLAAARLLGRRDGLFDNDGLRQFIASRLPPGVRRFGDLAARAYVTGTNLNTGTLRVFGDDPDDLILDGLMASTALPPYFPPWECEGYQYVDGAAVAGLPIGVALDRGATEIYAVTVEYCGETVGEVRGILPIVEQTLNAMTYQQLLCDLERCRQRPGVTLHLVAVCQFQGIPMWDMSQAAEMVKAGRAAMRTYLETGKPLIVTPPRRDLWGQIRRPLQRALTRLSRR